MRPARSPWPVRIEFAALVAISLLALLQLSACGNASVTPADRDAAEAFVRKEQSSLVVKPVALWYADARFHAMCGEIEAPAALARIRPTLRYIYFGDQKSGSIEPHEMWIATDPRSAAILREGRTIFGRAWATLCQPHAPLTRRIADWWSGIDKYDEAPTPITDAFTRDLLNKARQTD